MPHHDLYWNAMDFDSEESLTEFPSNSTKHQSYVDPWDLENYAYIREHLDSMELSSSPSLPVSGSSEEFAEANSTSFYYVPGNKKLPESGNDDKGTAYVSFVSEQGNYAAIDEVKLPLALPQSEYMYEGPARRRVDKIYEEYEDYPDENVYGKRTVKENSVFGIYDKAGHFRKVAVPVAVPPVTNKLQRDRSLSFSYGDYDHDPYATRQEIYSKLDDLPVDPDASLPIYDDLRRTRRKPNNFSLSNYGHLKIDYSYSWNNLNKYIKYN